MDASFRESTAPSAAASPSSHMSSWCDLCESENNYEIRCNHLQSGPLCYDMSYSDDDSDWVHASVSEDAMCVLPECPRSLNDLPFSGTVSLMPECHQDANATPQNFVRAICQELETVIVDSGADLSCVPLSYSKAGEKVAKAFSAQVRDAQGSKMKVAAQRNIQFRIVSRDGRPITLREKCIATGVSQPLLSLGRLIKAGWYPSRDDYGMFLVHQQTGAEIPMQFRGNSLSVDASVFRVEDDSEAEGEPIAYVRFTPAEPSDELENSPYGWHMSSSGNHFVWRGTTALYIDPSLLVPLTFPCRTTLVQYQGSWKILEKCVEWELLINPTAPLPCGEADCITILSSGDEDPELFGVKVEGAVESYSGEQGEAEQPADFGGGIGEDFDFDFQMGQEPEESAPPVLEPVAPVADAFEAPPVRQQAEQDVVIDGVSLSVHSALGALKAACEKLGLSKSGSKQRCFDRLKGYVQKQQLSAEAEIAQHAAAASSRDPNMQPAPVMASREA